MKNLKITAVAASMLFGSFACVPTGVDPYDPGNQTQEPAGTNQIPVSVVTAPIDIPVIVGQTIMVDTNSFEHMEVPLDQFSLLSRAQEEGPPEIASRLHGCQKMQYATVGNVLRSLGIDLAATAPAQSAGGLYTNGGQALGAPIFASRTPEGSDVTTAGATRLFDIFVQAAPAVVTAMPNLARCRVNGVGTQMFDASGNCTLDGISCLAGRKATESDQSICNAAVTRGSTPQIGRIIAVAAILAAANTCE